MKPEASSSRAGQNFQIGFVSKLTVQPWRGFNFASLEWRR